MARDAVVRLVPSDVDQLARVTMGLISELWIARDRLAILERLLEEKGILPEGAVGDYAPDQAFSDKLATLRDIMVMNTLGASTGERHSVSDLVAIGERWRVSADA